MSKIAMNDRQVSVKANLLTTQVKRSGRSQYVDAMTIAQAFTDRRPL